jgi:hypothetical protein
VSKIAKNYADTISYLGEEYKWLRTRRAAYITLSFELWEAHFKLFCAGAYVSDTAIPAKFVGSHHKVRGDIQTQVKIGTYVHVDGGVVYSDGCMPREAWIEYDNDVPPTGIIEVGRLINRENLEYSKPFSAIVWGKSYDRPSGLDDDDYMSDGEMVNHHHLHYHLIVLGSSGLFRYDQWNLLYSPLKEYARRNIIDDDATDDSALDSSDYDDDA